MKNWADRRELFHSAGSFH